MKGAGCDIGLGCELEPQIDIGFRPNIKMGSHCEINQRVTIKSVELGDYVMVGPGVVFLDRDHNFSSTEVPMAKQGVTERKQTIVSDDVWVGQNAIIMPGLTIGEGAIVGAGSTITRDVDADALALERNDEQVKSGWAARFRKLKSKIKKTS